MENTGSLLFLEMVPMQQNDETMMVDRDTDRHLNREADTQTEEEECKTRISIS